MTGRLDMIRGARYAVVYLFILSVIIGALNLFWTNHQVRVIQGYNSSSCNFFADIGSAPIAAPPQGKPSKLGVSIVVDSRLAWHGRRCAGTLPPPSAELMRWAAYYHLEVK